MCVAKLGSNCFTNHPANGVAIVVDPDAATVVFTDSVTNPAPDSAPDRIPHDKPDHI